MLERTVALSRVQFGETHWRTGEARLALGTCLLKAGKKDRAEPLLRQAYTEIQPQKRAQPRLIARAERVMASAGIQLPNP